MFFHTPHWDLSLEMLINQTWRCAFFDWIMPIISWRIWLVIAGVGGALWLWRKRGLKAAGVILIIALTVGVSDTTCNLIKKSVGRVRPLNAIAGAWFHDDGEWQRRPADFVQTEKRGKSYPSGHATNSMAAALMAMLFFPALRPWLFILPLLVGYSRVYLAKHYPTDVMAGWVLGAIVALTLYMLWRAVLHWLEVRKRRRLEVS